MFVGINVFFVCFSQKKELSKIGLDGGKRKAESGASYTINFSKRDIWKR